MFSVDRLTHVKTKKPALKES